MDRQRVMVMLLACLVAIVLIPHTPIIKAIPGRDSGVFGYVGWRILNGEIPYRDVWDHKPPLIYYIDALGLVMTPNSMWGIWVLEFLSLSTAAVLGFLIIQHEFGGVPAIGASLVWVMSLVLVLGGGNRPEEFALPLQFAALYLFVHAEKQKSHPWREFLLGITGGMAFFLKQNLIGIWLSIALYRTLTGVFSHNWRRLWASLAAMLLGALSVAGIVVWYFAAHNALSHFWDAVFRFNFVYSSRPLVEHVKALYYGFEVTARSGISILGIAAWVAGLFYVASRRAGHDGLSPLLSVALIALPVEFLFASISGSWFTHYDLPWLPAFAILTGFFLNVLISNLRPAPVVQLGTKKVSASTIWVSAFIVAMTFVPTGLLFNAIIPFSTDNNPEYETVYQTIDYIEKHTTDGDYVLIWGGGTRINFVTRRPSPIRFTYQYPLFMRKYQNEEMIDELLDELMRHKPVLIIDNWTGTEDLGTTDFAERQRQFWRNQSDLSWAPLPGMDKVFDYISSNYEFVDTVGLDRWPIYAYMGQP